MCLHKDALLLFNNGCGNLPHVGNEIYVVVMIFTLCKMIRNFHELHLDNHERGSADGESKLMAHAQYTYIMLHATTIKIKI